MPKDVSVLILDDEENILSSLRRLFVNEPFDVATTTRPSEALDILAQKKIKVVLSDQRMPDMTGVDFLKQVKEKYPEVIRILFTGHADLEVAEEAINIAGIYRFINKPWSSEELRVAVNQAIHHFDLIVENKSFFEATTAQNKELELLNRKLKVMYEVQKEFSSTVSHELRTPLASIKTAIDIVMSGTAGELNADQKNFLNKAKDNVDRLNRLISDILDLSRLESGRAALNIKENDINALIAEVVDIQRPVAEKQGIYLKTQLDPGLPKIFFDNDKINQILSNLVSNAIKFTEKGGVTVSSQCHMEGNHIVISVKDTGHGIGEDDMPKLFQKFQQLGDPALRKTGGTGLGLAICKQITSQHGGRIWAESKLGEGSSFCFLLPIRERRKPER